MKFALPCLLALSLTLTLPAWADVSRNQAVEIAVKANGGRVLSVERAQRDGQAFWRVKLLTPQGEVKVVWIYATSGQTR
ncbi:MAG: PepSY domain-containing protein [Rhodoferax sp.]|nr:PepSY domain-containing protein [Rhodoferax sp.]